MHYTYSDIAKMIDHSLLIPTMTEADLVAGIELARAYDVASVCIMPFALKRCAELLAGSTVKTSTTKHAGKKYYIAVTKIYSQTGKINE